MTVCLKAPQNELLKYCMCVAALAKHELYNDVVCWNLTDKHISQYKQIINTIEQTYAK